MNIISLNLQNFKCFRKSTFEFSEGMNVIAGPNASGKTALLDALAVAAASWMLGIRGYASRPIKPDDVSLKANKYKDNIAFEHQFPVNVSARGMAQGVPVMWLRSLYGPKGRTTRVDARDICKIAKGAVAKARNGESVTLPMISYYGTGRLWLEPKQSSRIKDYRRASEKKETSRLEGYRNSIYPRLSTKSFVEWIARQAWIEYQQGRKQSVYSIVRQAILGCIEGGEHMYFDPKRGEVIVRIKELGEQPFNHLSDGQRTMLALVGDLAQKAVRLNPHLGDKALEKTPGVVLIDEFEMHLHPSWQRRVVDDLSRTFPKVQFFCTTHSPQIIGQTPRNQVFLLTADGQWTHPPASFGLDSNEVLEVLMGASASDPEVVELRLKLLTALEDLDVETAESLLAQLRDKVEGPSATVGELETLIGNTRALLADDEEVKEEDN